MLRVSRQRLSGILTPLALGTSRASPCFLVVYYQNAAGSWVWWDQSPVLSASAAYTHASWTTQPVPTGAVKLSFGLSLRTVGSVTMDDFSLLQN